MNSLAHRRRSLVLPGLLACCLVVAGRAQSPATSSQGTTAPAPVELSPFVVDESQDVGYLANNTLAGSRLNTRLKDTPATISVITAEFLQDLGAFRLDEALAYAVNVEFDQDDSREAINSNSTFSGYQDYRVRGLDTSQARNYFSTGRIPIESAFVERIEDSRGPNSVVFGIGSPGGIINVSTKRALFGRAFQKASLTLGSYDTYRGTLDLNQPLADGKLALRLNLVHNDAQSFRHWEFEEHQRAHLAAGYRLTDRTRVRVEFERGRVRSNRAVTFNLLDQFSAWDAAGRPTFARRTTSDPLGINQQNNNTRVTYYANNNTVFDERRNNLSSMVTRHPRNNVVTDRRVVDDSVNHGGPAQNRASHFSVGTAYLEHQFGDNTFVEVAYNHLEHKWDFRDPRGPRRQLFGDPNQLRADGSPNPFAGQLYLEAFWFRGHRFDQADSGRATISHRLDAGKWGRYRIGGYGEYEKHFVANGNYTEQWIDPATGRMAFHPTPGNANNNVWRRTYPTPGDWASYHVSGPLEEGGLLENVFDPVTGRTLSSAWIRNGGPTEVHASLKSAMVVAQARYFRDRLIVAAGLRRDEFAETTVGRRRNPDTQIWELERNPALAESGAGQNSAIGRTKTMGVVYHVTPKISLSYNLSDNVAVPDAGDTMLHPSGDPDLEPVPVPKPEGKGQDFGIGVSLFDDRLYIKATQYVTQGKDQSITSPSAVRTSNVRIMDELLEQGLITQDVHDRRTDVGGQGLFGHESTGTELQATGNPTRNWRLTASYAYVKPVEDYRFTEWLRWEEINRQFLAPFNPNLLLDNNRTLAAELQFIREELASQTAATGVGKLGTRHHKVSLFTRFSFSETRLKGLYVGGGYRHQSRMFVGLDDAGRKLYGNSFWNIDALAGYTFRNIPRLGAISLQLNVYNVFNNRDPLVLRYDIDHTTVFRERVTPPTTWKLTASFEF